MPGTVEVYRESKESYEPAWRKGITMKPTRCTGLYFLGKTSFHVSVCMCSRGCHLAFGASLFPDHSTVNLASPMAVSNWIYFPWACPLTSGRRSVWTDVVSIFDSLVTISLTLAVKLV